jgi:hypothetical protein
MRRSLTTLTCALMVAIAPAALFAQTQPPAQQPPAQQPPAQQPPAAQPPAAPKLSFTTDAGLLLIQVKKDQTTAFEEMIAKLKSGGAKTADETIKKQLAGWKVFKSSEDMAGNALYVVMIDPAVKDAEYELFGIVQKVMTPEELRAPETQDMFKKWQAAFAAGYNKLNLTPVGGGM